MATHLRDAARNQLADQRLVRNSVIDELVQLLEAHPRPVDVVRLFEAWRRKVAFDLDDVIALVSCRSIPSSPVQTCSPSSATICASRQPVSS